VVDGLQRVMDASLITNGCIMSPFFSVMDSDHLYRTSSYTTLASQFTKDSKYKVEADTGVSRSEGIDSGRS
jgi:hypothetical protein